jgi:hypothetical protein
MSAGVTSSPEFAGERVSQAVGESREQRVERLVDLGEDEIRQTPDLDHDLATQAEPPLGTVDVIQVEADLFDMLVEAINRRMETAGNPLLQVVSGNPTRVMDVDVHDALEPHQAENNQCGGVNHSSHPPIN